MVSITNNTIWLIETWKLYCLKTTQQFDSLYGGNDPRVILYKVCVFCVNTNIKGGLPLQDIVLHEDHMGKINEDFSKKIQIMIEYKLYINDLWMVSNKVLNSFIDWINLFLCSLLTALIETMLECSLNDCMSYINCAHCKSKVSATSGLSLTKKGLVRKWLKSFFSETAQLFKRKHWWNVLWMRM